MYLAINANRPIKGSIKTVKPIDTATVNMFLCMAKILSGNAYNCKEKYKHIFTKEFNFIVPVYDAPIKRNSPNIQ